MMIVGSRAKNQSAKTELLDLASWTWTETADYPPGSNGDIFHDGGLVYIYPHFYMFGGRPYGSSPGSHDEIHRYDEFEHAWEANFGQLNMRRENFSFILKGYTLMIYGGRSLEASVDDGINENMAPERCVFEGDSINCTTVAQPVLNNAHRPFLFFVEDDFCRGLAPSY